MSGHSKWATTKRHKAAIDAKRGKIFSVLSKELIMAARAGGGDADMNPRLRTVLQKAKAANMPNDNVQRAIQKGTGELPGVTIEEVLYEGYGPGGVALMIEVATDNTNRSVGEVRSTLTKNGGNLGGSGAVAYNFSRMGQFVIAAEKTDEETLMECALEAGAEDILSEADHFEVRCPITEYEKVSRALEEAGIEPDSSELAYIPESLVPVTEVEDAKRILRVIDLLEELEDVQNVYANFDMADSILEAAEE
ncbi:MAG: YebC/PmpR family DNA-binding transcriptional regulator [Verrucomicrobia bacterium]|nr:YebC/PmpR family DNA-binding transcriptional regulator [Verrucomicrobiota bacterium]MDA1066902.1 YebC/PmpR family DNA-binding transcriptional regulator [Verrucomicrobiota bacterium]